MKKGPVILVVLLVVVAAIIFFSMSKPSVSNTPGGLNNDNSYDEVSVNNDSSSTNNQENTENNSNTDNETPQPRTYNLEISGFAYKSNSIVVKVGDTIIWTNKDSSRHTVTSDSGSELDSELLRKSETYSHTFNIAGEFSYHCTPHPYMKGKVIVERV